MRQARTEFLRDRPAPAPGQVARTQRMACKGIWRPVMGYEMVERSLAAFDGIIARLGVKLEDDSPIKKDFDTTREFLNDKKTMKEAEWLAKWDPRFKEFYHA